MCAICDSELANPTGGEPDLIEVLRSRVDLPVPRVVARAAAARLPDEWDGTGLSQIFYQQRHTVRTTLLEWIGCERRRPEQLVPYLECNQVDIRQLAQRSLRARQEA